MGAFAVGALAMIGLPPTAGFLGKWFMLQRCHADRQLAGRRRDRRSAPCSTPPISCRSSSAPSSARLPKHDEGDSHGEAPWPIVVALTATAAGRSSCSCFRNPLRSRLHDDRDGDAMDRPLARDRGQTIKRLLWLIFVVVLAATGAAGSRRSKHHPYFGLDGTFGFGAWFGFASCVAMIVLRQGAGRHSSSGRILTMTSSLLLPPGSGPDLRRPAAAVAAWSAARIACCCSRWSTLCLVWQVPDGVALQVDYPRPRARARQRATSSRACSPPSSR